MKILNWLAMVLTLGVIGMSYGLYRLEPTLLIGTPWEACTWRTCWREGLLRG